MSILSDCTIHNNDSFVYVVHLPKSLQTVMHEDGATQLVAHTPYCCKEDHGNACKWIECKGSQYQKRYACNTLRVLPSTTVHIPASLLLLR